MRPLKFTATVMAVGTLAFVGLGHAATEGHSLYISDYAFVVKPEAIQEPPDSERLRDPAPRKIPLVLWTKLAGDEEGIARLKRGGFKLVHKWTINCGKGQNDLDQNIAGEEIPFDYDGDIPWPEVAKLLEKEIPLTDSHEFDWRTVSQRDYVVGCRYTVRVVDELDKELYCAPHAKPCVLTISVQKQ